MIVAVALALSASLFYGTSDFLGAFTARKLTVITSSTVIFVAATGATTAALLVTTWSYSDQALWAGVIAGVAGTVGMITFYAALAIGPMGLLAPLIALVQTAIPVVIAASLGESLPPIAWFAVGLALVATTLISVPAKTATGQPAIQRITLRGAMLGLVSGVTLGFAVVSLDAAPGDSGVFAAFVDVAVGLVILLPMVAVRRLRTSDEWLHGASAAVLVPEPARRKPAGAGIWALSAVSGVLLGVGNALLVVALHSGNLAVVAVLVSLYPLATVFLAWVFLKERMSLPQLAGVALAIAAAVLLGTS